MMKFIDFSVILIIPLSILTIYYPTAGAICFSLLVILFWWLIGGLQKIIDYLLARIADYETAAKAVKTEVEKLIDLIK